MEHFAVCHVHSKWSYDGSWSLEELSAKFSRRGCRVLMMTEHDRGFTATRLDQYREACAQASSSEILVVPGIEYSDSANRVHVLVWGPVPFLGENLPTSEMLGAVHAAGGLAVLAHPSRRDAWKTFDPSWTGRLLGIETWNRKYDGWAPSKTAPALMETSGAIPFVGLDFHTERQSFPLGMALDMDETVSEEAILNCMRSRRVQPRAFGLPLNERLVSKVLPFLGMAERSRQMVASIAKHSKAPARS
jgi:predicted metal-dependent phosphoesterase TrpH